MAFCQGCGTPIQQTDAVCPNCGMAIANQIQQGMPSDKQVIVHVQAAAVPAPPGRGLSIASLVLGIIVSVDTLTIIVETATIIGIPVAFCSSLFAIPVAIVGLILGIIGKNKLKAAGAPFGMATAGIVMNTILLAIVAIIMVIMGILGAGIASSTPRYRF